MAPSKNKKLAELFGVTVNALMNPQTQEKKAPSELPALICRSVALAMGVATVVLSALKQIDLYSGLGMLAVGLISLSILQFLKENRA